AFRRHTLLPLNDCLSALQPHLTRSSLHRCLRQHGISRLPAIEDSSPDKRKFKAYPIGYFHIDIAESSDRMRDRGCRRTPATQRATRCVASCLEELPVISLQ